jgi:hypothetical protein
MNYPTGVTGNEYQIAGAENNCSGERQVQCWNHDCSRFEQDQEVTMDLAFYRGDEFGNWTCATCKRSNQYIGEPYV